MRWVIGCFLKLKNNLKSVSELWNIEGKFTVKRMRIVPNAIGLGKTEKDKEFLLDIIKTCNRVQKYINGIKYDDF